MIVSAEKAGWATSSVVLGIDHVRNRVELLANTLWRERGRLELEVELTLKPDDAGSKRR